MVYGLSTQEQRRGIVENYDSYNQAQNSLHRIINRKEQKKRKNRNTTHNITSVSIKRPSSLLEACLVKGKFMLLTLRDIKFSSALTIKAKEFDVDLNIFYVRMEFPFGYGN